MRADGTWRLPRWVLYALPVLGVLGGLGLLMVIPSLHSMGIQQDSARLDLVGLQHALRRYHEAHQRFPSTEEGLQPLVESPRLDRLPLDPWGNPYRYELREGRPVVWSLGADGRPGGKGRDQDIVCVLEEGSSRSRCTD